MIDLNHFTAGVERLIETGMDRMLRGYEYHSGGAARVKAPAPVFSGQWEYPGVTAQVLAEAAGANIVYALFAPALPPSVQTAEAAEALFTALNNRGRANCMPRRNAEHRPAAPTPYGYCLYAGSCRKPPLERMRYHLEDGSSSYGLHLGAWWDNPAAPITIAALSFDPQRVSEAYLRQIEDILWDEYRPLFGKRGPR